MPVYTLELSLHEEDFWASIYVAAVKSGSDAPEAQADTAVRCLRVRIEHRYKPYDR